jgi:hypothetical protein
MTVDGPINDRLIFDHPRLRLLRIADQVQTVSLPAGARSQASVIIPSYATLRTRLCGQNETGTEAQGMMAGYVKDPYGKPLASTHIWVTWQIQWVEQNGRLVATNQQRTVETDSNTDGSYMMCGLSRGAKLTAKASVGGRPTLEEKLVVPASMVLEHDFQFVNR